MKNKMFAVHYYDDEHHGYWYVDIASSWRIAYERGVQEAYLNCMDEELNPDADVWEIKENCPMSQYEMERELEERPYVFIEDWCFDTSYI